MVGIYRFSRYSHAVALKNKTSKTVAKALEGYVLSTVQCTSEVIFTDWGPEFKGREFNKVLARSSIDTIIRYLSYHIVTGGWGIQPNLKTMTYAGKCQMET